MESKCEVLNAMRDLGLAEDVKLHPVLMAGQRMVDWRGTYYANAKDGDGVLPGFGPEALRNNPPRPLASGRVEFLPIN